MIHSVQVIGKLNVQGFVHNGTIFNSNSINNLIYNDYFLCEKIRTA